MRSPAVDEPVDEGDDGDDRKRLAEERCEDKKRVERGAGDLLDRTKNLKFHNPPLFGMTGY